MSGVSTTRWRCLRGRGDMKYSDNWTKGSNQTSPSISPGLRTWPSFISSSEEGIGLESFEKKILDQTFTKNLKTYLPEIKIFSIDTSKFMLIFYFHLFLQIIHRLIHPNLNREGPVGLPKNLTEDCEIGL